jgi:hypothetical protein
MSGLGTCMRSAGSDSDACTALAEMAAERSGHGREHEQAALQGHPTDLRRVPGRASVHVLRGARNPDIRADAARTPGRAPNDQGHGLASHPTAR